MLESLSSFYMPLKHIHMTCALISIIFFSVRAIWAFNGSALLQKKWVKITPHIVDTILLFSAICLAIAWVQNGALPAWISAKLIGLVAYIFFGVMTLKKAKNAQQRFAYFALALLTFAYIVGVAFTKNAMFYAAIG